MKKILLIDDEQIVLDFLQSILTEFDVDSATDVETGLKYAKKSNYDLIITDLRMKPLTGFDFIAKLDIRVPIFVISSLTDRESLLRAFKLGVVDYIMKPIDEEVTLAKIKNFLNVKEQKDFTFQDDLTVAFDNSVVAFTRTEYDILKLLCKIPNRIYSKEEIMDIIWYGNKSMSNKIIDVNISNIRKKLGKYSGKIVTVKYRGYKYEK